MSSPDSKQNKPPAPAAGGSGDETKAVLSRLGEIAAQHNIPIDAQFELTHRCNLKCEHCYLTGPDAARLELSLQEIESALDQLAAAGTLMLTLTGGEPMLRKDFFQILHAAKKRAFAVILFTNGTLIGEAEADKLAAAGVLDTGVSLYGATARAHDSVMRVPGSFDKTVAALNLLRERGMRVTLKSVIMKQNFSERLDMIALAESMGMRYIFDPVISPRNNGSPDALDNRLTVEQTAELYQHPHFYPDDNQGPWQLGPDPACYAGRNTVAINPYGDVLPCLQFIVPMGNLRDKTFARIWSEQSGYSEFKNLKPEDLKSCAPCNIKQYCAICPGLSLLETGSVTLPCPASCDLAKARKLFHDSK